jgi:hypothetical protein
MADKKLYPYTIYYTSEPDIFDERHQNSFGTTDESAARMHISVLKFRGHREAFATFTFTSGPRKGEEVILR